MGGEHRAASWAVIQKWMHMHQCQKFMFIFKLCLFETVLEGGPSLSVGGGLHSWRHDAPRKFQGTKLALAIPVIQTQQECSCTPIVLSKLWRIAESNQRVKYRYAFMERPNLHNKRYANTIHLQKEKTRTASLWKHLYSVPPCPTQNAQTAPTGESGAGAIVRRAFGETFAMTWWQWKVEETKRRSTLKVSICESRRNLQWRK